MAEIRKRVHVIDEGDHLRSKEPREELADDEPVIGVEEFNPNYIKREPQTPSYSYLDSPPSSVSSPPIPSAGTIPIIEQTGA